MFNNLIKYIVFIIYYYVIYFKDICFVLGVFLIFYVVCFFGECLGDMKIIIDNNVYDNILNIFKFEI